MQRHISFMFFFISFFLRLGPFLIKNKTFVTGLSYWIKVF